MSQLQSIKFRRDVASSLLFLESAIVFSLDIFLIYKGLTAENTSDPKALAGEIFFYTAGALLIFLMGMGVRRSIRFATAPAILTNLISVGISWYMISGGLVIFGLVLASVGISVVLLLGSLVNK
jgi:hypothetical protein